MITMATNNDHYGNDDHYGAVLGYVLISLYCRI